jgi:hypothetical protein
MCEAVRYRIEGEALAEFVCHCRACQYVSGGAGANVVVAARADVHLTAGEPRTYWSKSDSGAVVGRQFCEICGTPLFSDLEAQPDLMIIKVGSLDDPAKFKPSANHWAEAAQPWHRLDDDLPTFPKGPQDPR